MLKRLSYEWRGMETTAVLLKKTLKSYYVDPRSYLSTFSSKFNKEQTIMPKELLTIIDSLACFKIEILFVLPMNINFFLFSQLVLVPTLEHMDFLREPTLLSGCYYLNKAPYIFGINPCLLSYWPLRGKHQKLGLVILLSISQYLWLSLYIYIITVDLHGFSIVNLTSY